MRILWDCRSITEHMGGIGRATVGWLQNFIREKPKRWDVVLLFFAACKEEFLLCAVPNLKEIGKVHCVNAGMVAPRFEQIELPTLLELERIDLYFNPSFTIPAVKTTRFQCSVVHDVVFFEHPEWVERDLCGYLAQGTDLALKRADAVFTVSEFSRCRINELAPRRGWGKAGGVSVVMPSLSEVLLAETCRLGDTRQSGDDGRADFLLYIGAIEQKKGVNLLLDAYAVLRKEMNSHCPTLILAGGVGGQRYDLDGELGRRGLKCCVQYLGWVSEEEKLKLLRQAKMFVFPSLYEGFGIPPLEAMAFGTPVIATRATSLPEVLGDAALYVEPGDTAGLAKTMRNLLGNSELCTDLGTKGRAQAARYGGTVPARALVSSFLKLESTL